MYRIYFNEGYLTSIDDCFKAYEAFELLADACEISGDDVYMVDFTGDVVACNYEREEPTNYLRYF